MNYSYRELITEFLAQGYMPEFFSPQPSDKHGLILRHDIDFDVNYAYELSKIEDDLGVNSTYFFLLHSKSYNLFEKDHIDKIHSMSSMGHQISIHFDPTIYCDIEEGFQKEKALFELMFDLEVKYLSVHRPSEYFLNNEQTICGVRHTYQPMYFKDIKYFADSQGAFRYGHPLDSEAFKKKDTIQLLTHPIWWVTKATRPVSKLNEFLEYRVDRFRHHMASNCLPYDEFMREEQCRK